MGESYQRYYSYPRLRMFYSLAIINENDEYFFVFLF